MARTKAFDPERRLEKALEIFWCQGYDATSIADLVEGMELSRSSLYETYGDKRALYLAALERYRQQEGAAMRRLLEEAPTVVAAFRQIFEGIVAEAVADDSRRGCFMTNSMVELAPHDPAVAELARRNLDEVTALFTAAIRRGQAQGELDGRRDAEALAHYLFNAILGLRVLAKSTRERAVLTNVAETTLQVLA